MSEQPSDSQSSTYKRGDWIVHTKLRRMGIFIKAIGNGCRIKLLTGEHLVCLLGTIRLATEREKEAGVNDVWTKIDAENRFDPDSLNELRKLIGV